MSDGIHVDAVELRYWRHKRVLSRHDLAEKADVGHSTLANIESGHSERARVKTLRAIASALRIEPSKLVAVVERLKQ